MKVTRRKFLMGTVSALVLTTLNIYDWRLLANLESVNHDIDIREQAQAVYVGASGYSTYITTTGNASQVSLASYLDFPHHFLMN